MQEPTVLYENDDFLALAKPAGVVVHHDRKHTSGTIVDWLLENTKVGHTMSNFRDGIVHRLDKDTSGVLLVVKTQAAHEYLKDLFQKGKIIKTYRALVAGIIKNDTGFIDAPLARSTKHFEKRVVGGRQGRSREARTGYRVLERFSRGDPISAYTYIEAFPKTGRTHQIRSHMAHLGHPVACDALYGGKKFACPPGLERQFLHAYSLSFLGPDGARYEIEAPLPLDLEEALKRLRQPA